VNAEDEDNDSRPWERPGALRRDCEPHQGTLLRLLAVASVGVGMVAFVLLVLAAQYRSSRTRLLLLTPSCLCAILAPALAVAARLLARRDVRRMRAGVMDPAGEGSARTARFVSVLGLAVGLLVAVMLLREFGPGFGFFAVAVGGVLLFLVAVALT
jgi:hypothetical protein